MFCCRICWFVEFALDVANIFRIEYFSNWGFWATKSSSIFSIIFEWIDWNRIVRSALALVINQLNWNAVGSRETAYFTNKWMCIYAGHAFWRHHSLERLQWRYKFRWPCYSMCFLKAKHIRRCFTLVQYRCVARCCLLVSWWRMRTATRFGDSWKSLIAKYACADDQILLGEQQFIVELFIFFYSKSVLFFVSKITYFCSFSLISVFFYSGYLI